MKNDVLRSLLAIVVLLISSRSVIGKGFDPDGTIPDWEPNIWSYEGETGPAHWAALADAYKECGEGLQQSPIDIGNALFSYLPPLSFNYHTSMVSIHRKPNQMWLEYDSGSHLKVGGKYYRFLGFDFHTPGEHSFRGSRPDMEIHLHHLSASGEPLIVAIPVNGGHRKNITLSRIWENIPEQRAHRINRRVGINAMFLLPADRSYYTYQGSETRPPCEEGVQWIVMQSPLRVSWEDIERFKSVLGANARDTQPLNDRVILSSAR